METSTSSQNKGSRNTTTNTDQPTPIPNPPQSSPSSSSTTKEQVPPHYVRSYTCTFCEKGFSNAQALGGHMNIHRRDRARLRNMDDSELGTKHAAYTTMISWDPTNHNLQRDPDARLLRLFDAGPSTEEVDLELRLGSPSSSSAPKGS